MNDEARKEIERRENLTAQFISQYNEKRNANKDPVLRLGYAVTKYYCTCGHSRNIHLANDGMCCANSGESFNCDCLGFEER